MNYKYSAQGGDIFTVLTMFLDCICEELGLQKDGKDRITDLGKLSDRTPL